MLVKKLRSFLGKIKIRIMEANQHRFVTSAACKKDLYSARIIRLVHSIEKGLSIESPRPEFGYEKIKTLYSWIKEYLQMKDIDKTCLYMAADAFAAYCQYHNSLGISSSKLDEIKEITEGQSSTMFQAKNANEWF